MTTVRTPWHFWLVGGLSLLWNLGGAYDYLMTQTHNDAYLAAFSAEQRAFFDSYPVWMVVAWAFGVWGAVAGSLLLLLRSRYAVTAFAVSLAGLAVSSLWQFALSGANIRTTFGTGPMIMIALIWLIEIALLVYARRQVALGHLR
jgi:hypothetical protein